MGKGAPQDCLRSPLSSLDFQRAQAGLREVREGTRRGGTTRETKQNEGTQRAVSKTARGGQSSWKVRETIFFANYDEILR